MTRSGQANGVRKFKHIRGKLNFYGFRLNLSRQARGMSLRELGEKVGLTRQAISLYELGKVRPSDERIKMMARELDMPCAFLMLSPIKTPDKG